MGKKNFQVQLAHIKPAASAQIGAGSRGYVVPANTVIRFPENASANRTFDFGPFYDKGFNEVVFACQQTIEGLLSESISTRQAFLSVTTISCYCGSGLRYFFGYCILLYAGFQRDIRLSDITQQRIAELIHFLKGLEISPVSQKTIYSQVKSVLVACYKAGHLTHVDIKTLFPSNPFPNTNKKTKGQRPLSQQEKRQLVVALKSEMSSILSTDAPLSSFDLTVCALAIGMSTGMNPTPLLSLPTDCLQPHPLKANLRLLVAFKRRGNATHVVSLRQSEDIALLCTVKLNVVDTIDMIIERNAALRGRYSNVNHLLVFQTERGGNSGSIRPLSTGSLYNAIQNLIEKHDLTDDDGRPMILNMMRLRKTFINRIWELSDQDPLITARHGKHTPQTANQHYWEAPPEAERNMRFIGEARIQHLLGVTYVPAERTAVAGCKDTRYGHMAPKNGTVCTDILSCFRCKSFVVTEDDLYRLYSFYWAVVHERDSFGAKRWEKYLHHIIRIIDNDIGPQFDAEQVRAAREQARTSPHPFWRNLDMVRLAR